MKFAAYAMPSYWESFGLTESEFLRATIDHLAAAEILGFDSIWVNEHHFHQFGGFIPSLPTMLAALSQRTVRVRLGTSVVVLPLHNPLEVAEQLAMVDLMSDGRVEFGIGRGFVIHDYDVLGVPYHDAQDRLLESLDVILKAWRGEPFTHQGRYYDFRDLTVWPRTAQQPHPPIWVACSSSAEHFAWTAEQGFGLLTVAYNKPVAALGELTAVYRQAWESSHPGAPYNIATHFHVVVGEDSRQARRIAESGLTEHVRMSREARSLAAGGSPVAETLSVERLVDEGRLIAGDPDGCVQLLRRVRAELGSTEVHCLFQFGDIPFPIAQQSMELFSDHVMPLLRELEPVGSGAR